MSKKILIATNEIVTIVAEAKGWTTIKTKDGERKVRAKELADVPKTTKAKAEKAPGAGPRVAAPAHFVADVAGEKIAKIGGTEFNLGRYFVSDVKTESGRRTIDCADDIAEKLRGLPLDDVYALAAEELGCRISELQNQYQHLNAGMQRMNLGNRIRGARAAKAREAAKAAEAAAKPAKAEKAAEDKPAKATKSKKATTA